VLRGVGGTPLPAQGPVRVRVGVRVRVHGPAVYGRSGRVCQQVGPHATVIQSNNVAPLCDLIIVTKMTLVSIGVCV